MFTINKSARNLFICFVFMLCSFLTGAKVDAFWPFDIGTYDYRGFNESGIHKITRGKFDEYGYDRDGFSR